MTKYRTIGVEDIVISKHDARGVKQLYDDPLVILIAIEVSGDRVYPNVIISLSITVGPIFHR